MAKGIIYVTTTIVPGLIKIGRCNSDQFENRMYTLENNGYQQVVGLKRAFAIEVEDFKEKEDLLHTVFEKSQVAKTELFAVDINLVIQLLSSFDGKLIYPKDETKDELFDEATNNKDSKLIPDGTYSFSRKKKSDDKLVEATAVVSDHRWRLLKGSMLGIAEDKGVSKKAKATRINMPILDNGSLSEDFELGECSPSFAGTVVMNQSNNGWTDWKCENGKPVDIFRKAEKE